jgi:hypothetical protein
MRAGGRSKSILFGWLHDHWHKRQIHAFQCACRTAKRHGDSAGISGICEKCSRGSRADQQRVIFFDNHACTFSNSNAFANSNFITNANAEPESNRDPSAITDSFTLANSNIITDANSESESNRDSSAITDSFTLANSNRYAKPNTHSYSSAYSAGSYRWESDERIDFSGNLRSHRFCGRALGCY